MDFNNTIKMTPTTYERITDNLTKIYGAILFERHGIKHPITVYEPDTAQVDDVDSVLGPLSADFVDGFAQYDHAYLQSMQNAGRNLFNGTTFTMNHIRKSPLTISARLGKYYDMLATCGALEHELRQAAEGTLMRGVNRTVLHRAHTPKEVLRHGQGRSAAIGVAVLTVFNHGGVYKAMLGQRSAKAATDPLFYHLLPAFIFQPSSETLKHPQEWSVSHQIYREFLEELFGMDEVTSPKRHDYFYNHPVYVDLKTMLKSGQASLHLTGIAFNLLTLRPEICAALIIHDAGWYERVTQGADELRLDAMETQDGQITLVPIETDEAILAELPSDPHLMMPPQATAALWLGIDCARAKLANGH